LQFVADLDGCLSEIARCQKPGGRLIAIVEDGGLGAALQQVMTIEEWVVFVRVSNSQSFSIDLAAYFRPAFERAGLEFEARDAPFDVRWADIEELARMRWIPLASAAARTEAEGIMAAFGAKQKFASLNLRLTDRILLGHKAN